MKLRHTVFLLTPLLVLVLCAHGYATVECELHRTLNLQEAPLDVAVSLNGRWIFVLTDQGSILVYSADGNLNDEISVEESIDRIQVGPREDTLFLSSRKNKTVQVVTLHVIRNVNVSGSPFKGSANAPVAIAVFSDFQ